MFVSEIEVRILCGTYHRIDAHLGEIFNKKIIKFNIPVKLKFLIK